MLMIKEEIPPPLEIPNSNLPLSPTYISYRPMNLIGNGKKPQKSRSERSITNPGVFLKRSNETISNFQFEVIHKPIRGTITFDYKEENYFQTRRGRYETLSLPFKIEYKGVTPYIVVRMSR